jgi:ribosome-associated protein
MSPHSSSPRSRFQAHSTDPDLASCEPQESPSKTALKNEAIHLRKQGEKLSQRTALWANLALPEKLVDALKMAQTTRSFGGRKRQFQYVGKLMRQLSPAHRAQIDKALAK